MGSRDQRVLNREGDNLRIMVDFYLAVPDQPGVALATVSNAIQSFLASGNVPKPMTWTCPESREIELRIWPLPSTSRRSGGPGHPARASRLRRQLLD